MARVWSEIEALDGGLNAAERKLVAACKAGEVCVLGDGTRPEGPDPEREVRADVLRYLILGGCEDCRLHEWGVRLVGAWVSGELDLSFGVTNGMAKLVECRFEAGIAALQTQFEFLNLTGSALPALNAQGARVTGNVFLRGVQVDGVVSLAGAQIGGQLECDGGKFRNAEGKALNAQGARVTGAVLLRDGFEAEGEVLLAGAQIGGQLECGGGKFRNAEGKALNAQGAQVKGAVFLRGGFEAEGEVRLMSVQIGGQLDCEGGKFRNAMGKALNAQGMRVSGSYVWRKVEVTEGLIDLASAHVGDLADDLKSWPEARRLYLDGFTYDRISGAFTDVKQRLDWLARGTVWKRDFHPQPYSQLAKVYRGMGHEGAAREVLIERNRLLAVHQRKRLRAAGGDPSDKDVMVWGRCLGDFALRRLVGYGYAPFRSLGALVILWLVASWLAFAAWQEGSMVPNSDVILTSAAWQPYEPRLHAGEEWSAGGAPGQDWETFSALGWGVDLVVPILDLGQRAAWAPSTARGAWGAGLWWGQWLLDAAGWIVAGLFAAAVTGIIRKEDE